MNDLISRQAVINLLKQMRKDGDMVPWEGKDVFARIRKLPSAQPERKTGRWIYKKDLKQFFCDQCGEPSLTEDDRYIYSMDFSNFCPNCGARMEDCEA